jgi:hypothetical protein
MLDHGGVLKVNGKQERLFTGAFLFCICLQLAQSVHSAWFTYASGLSPQGPSHLFARPATLHAPDAYRIALPTLIRFAGRTLHIQDLAYVAAAFDLVAGFLALYLLYRLTVRPRAAEEPLQDRPLRILLFLAVLQFPIAWVVPWQRPETLPSALYLAFSLLALDRFRAHKSWLLAIAVATFFQSFVRSDVPFVFGVAVGLVGLMNARRNGLQTARGPLLAGTVIVLISGAIQAWLQFIRYPHLAYPAGTNPIQFGANLTIHQFETFTIALLPFLAFLLFLLIQRPALDIIDKTIVVAFLLYLPLWFTVGAVTEIRIDVPFLLALSTVFARVLGSCFSSKSVIS